MNRSVKIAASGLLFSAAYFFMKTRQVAAVEIVGQVGDVFSEAAQQTAEIIDQLTGGTMKLSAMASVTAADVANKNVQAFLRVIRRGEGTSNEAGYRTLFGGKFFNSFADHPRVKTYEKKDEFIRNGKKDFTTAAGAYQFTATTWDETARIMGLTDFSPASQDLAAVGRIVARGALDDVKAGRLEAAIKKCAKEWASLPYSPYGQPVISMATAASVFSISGGSAYA